MNIVNFRAKYWKYLKDIKRNKTTVRLNLKTHDEQIGYVFLGNMIIYIYIYLLIYYFKFILITNDEQYEHELWRAAMSNHITTKLHYVIWNKYNTVYFIDIMDGKLCYQNIHKYNYLLP